MIGYLHMKLYLTNGFDDKIISNSENKTFLPASKENPIGLKKVLMAVRYSPEKLQ